MEVSILLQRIAQGVQSLQHDHLHDIERDALLADIRELYHRVKTLNVPSPVVTPVIETRVAPSIEPVVEIPVVPTIDPIVEVVHHTPVVAAAIVTPVQEQRLEHQVEVQAPVTSQPVKGASINETKATDKASLNDLVAGNISSKVINDKASKGDLGALLDLNKRHVLTRELFGGDSHALDQAIAHINSAGSVQLAFDYIKHTLIPSYQWDTQSQSVRLFDKLVRQYYGI
jgi:hypothetical protein